MAGHLGEELLLQPLDGGVLGPEVVQLGPGVLILAAATDLLGEALLVGGEHQAAVLRADLRGQEAEAVVEVVRRRQGKGGPLGVGAELHLAPLAVERLQGLAGELEVAGEEAVALHGGRVALPFVVPIRLAGRARRLGVEKERQQVVALVAVVGLVLGVEGGGIGALGHGLHGQGLLGLRVVHLHEGGRVADVPVGLLVLLLEDLEDALVAAHLRVVAAVDQVGDDGRFALAVAVHPAVALLEDHQRPGQVEVHQPVREVVQVDAFACHVGAEQHAQRRLRLAEGLDDGLLLDIAHAAVEDLEGLVLELEVLLHPPLQPVQGLDALGEDHQAVLGVALLPAEISALQQREQLLVLAEARGVQVAQCQAQALQGLDLGLLVVAGLAGARLAAGELPDALGHRDLRRRRGAEDRLLQADAHQLAVALRRVFAAVGEGHIEQCLVGGLLLG